MTCTLPRQINLPEIIRTVNVTITGSGNATYCYAIIGGTKRSSAGGPYEVQAGDTITFAVCGHNIGDQGWVEIDGVTVISAKDPNVQTYAWTVPSGIRTISISFDYYSAGSFNRRGRITVTTA